MGKTFRKKDYWGNDRQKDKNKKKHDRSKRDRYDSLEPEREHTDRKRR